MIKIYSSHTDRGGSTEAFINLTNQFNRSGYEAVLMGPHIYPMNKCSFRRMDSYDEGMFDKDDHVIVHYTRGITKRPDVKSFILSCHEKHNFKLNEINLTPYDKVHYVSEQQRKWHNVEYPYFICGNIYYSLTPYPLTDCILDKKIGAYRPAKVGGVVGTVIRPKKTLEAIEWAFNDGCDEVLVFGSLTEDESYVKEIRNYMDMNFGTERMCTDLNMCGHVDNKQKMYDSFTDLYFCSESECLPNVIAEAKLTNKVIHIPEDKDYNDLEYVFDKKIVVSTWIKEFGVV